MNNTPTQQPEAADDTASEADYVLDSDDCISVIQGTWMVTRGVI